MITIPLYQLYTTVLLLILRNRVCVYALRYFRDSQRLRIAHVLHVYPIKTNHMHSQINLFIIQTPQIL